MWKARGPCENPSTNPIWLPGVYLVINKEDTGEKKKYKRMNIYLELLLEIVYLN
jgi:hypothetical protein